MALRAITRLRKTLLATLRSKYGFSKAAGGFHVRRFAHGYAGVDLQLSQFRDVMYVNVGWTFLGLPGFLQSRMLAPDEFELLDCAMHDRLDKVSRAEAVPTEWRADADAAADGLSRMLLDVADATCDSIGAHFTDPLALTSQLPPELVAQDFAERKRLAGGREGTTPTDYALVRRALHGFYPGTFPLALCLWWVSQTSGNRADARKYLDLAHAAAWLPQDKTIMALLTAG
jgi:hypothetical protein